MSLILSGTDGLSDVDGSASTPAIRGTDTNTGIFFPAADTIAFAEGGAECARFDSSGSLLVGTTTSLSKLTVQGTITAKASADESLLSISHNGSEAIISASYGSTGSYDPMVFKTSDAEVMRISSLGTVGIKQSADYYGQFAVTFDATNGGNNNLGVGLSPLANTSNAIYMMFYNATGNACGTISRNGTSNAVLYNTSSDYRLKENIAPVTGALAKVQALKPVTWTWKNCDGQTGEGFIAHEVQEVVPSAVSGEKDAVDAKGNPVYQGMDASYLVATLTAAIQELKAELDGVKAELATLKA